MISIYINNLESRRFLLLGCDPASLDDWYMTFRDNLVDSFARAEVYRNEYDFSLDMATLENDTITFSRKIGNPIIQDTASRSKETYTAAVLLRKSKISRSSYLFRCCIRSGTRTVSLRNPVPSNYY
jgi:hypothetical protein